MLVKVIQGILIDDQIAFKLDAYIDFNEVAIVRVYNDKYTTIHMRFGGEFVIKMPLEEARKNVEKAKEAIHKVFSGGSSADFDVEYEIYPEMHIQDQWKIRVDIKRYTNNVEEEDPDYEYEIVVNADFDLSSDILKTIMESVLGVEEFNVNTWPKSRYKAIVRIGELFDPKTIRDDVEMKIAHFLTDTH